MKLNLGPLAALHQKGAPNRRQPVETGRSRRTTVKMGWTKSRVENGDLFASTSCIFSELHG